MVDFGASTGFACEHVQSETVVRDLPMNLGIPPCHSLPLYYVDSTYENRKVEDTAQTSPWSSTLQTQLPAPQNVELL